MSPEEFERRSIAAETAASALLEQEAAEKLKKERATERRQRRAAKSKSKRKTDAPAQPPDQEREEAQAEAQEPDDGAAGDVSDTPSDEPAWLADLLDEFEVGDEMNARGRARCIRTPPAPLGAATRPTGTPTSFQATTCRAKASTASPKPKR